MKLARFATLAISVLLLGTFARAQAPAPAQEPIPVILDTDFVIPPQDDALALILALRSPELKILGVTTVAGNDTVQRGTSDALRVLEIAGRTEIPVYQGANRPWMHVGSAWAKTKHGKWWSDEPPPMPPGGFAKTKAQKESAVDFLIHTVDANPGQITIIAIGPLTNIATAIRQDANFARNVKRIAIMGGAFASLADGAGNMTPNAEFNIWVDPEAAWAVLHSGIPLEFTPLNVTRKTAFTKQYFDEIVSADTPITNLIKERMGPFFAKHPDARPNMYDELTVGGVVDPSLVKAVPLYVEIDTTHGPDYGTTLGATKPWEGGEDAVLVQVQTDVDFDRFIKMYVDRVRER